MSGRALSALALLLAAAASPAATLEDVAIEGGSDGPTVRLRLDTAVTARSQELSPRDGQPARIVVDLPGTRIAPGVRGTAGTGPLRRVRVGQFDATTARVVLDLAAPARFTLTADGADIAVRLTRGPAAATAPPPGASPPPARELPKAGAAPYLDYDDAEMQPLPTLPEDWRH